MKLAIVSLALVIGAVVSFAKDTPADDPIIQLPKFVVTDTRELPPPESWRYGTIAGFEVLSNASERATQRLIRDFDMFRQALSYVWPTDQLPQQPTSLIICGRGAKFDDFIPSGRPPSVSATASLLLRHGDRAAIVIDLEATTLNILNVDVLTDTANGTDSGMISVEHDKQLYREYVRFLLGSVPNRLPAWTEEGLSQIVMKMRFDKRTVEFARLEDPNEVSPQAAAAAALNAAAVADGESPFVPGAPVEDRDFSASLRRRGLVPLDRFFAIGHDSQEATSVLGNNIWAKQAYAFVHMCLYGEGGRYQKPFATFIQRLAKEPASEPLFKECFGMNYRQMLIQLRGYCDFTVYQHKRFQSKKGGPDLIVSPEPVAFREATQSEVGRIKGEAFLFAGHEGKGRSELIAPYIRGERDPSLLAALGLYERRYGEVPRARKFLEAAYAAKADRPLALVELARLRYDEALAQPAGKGGKFSRAQLVSVVEPLLLARKPRQPILALYDLLGDAWSHAETSPTREDVMPIVEGAVIFPRSPKLVFQAGVLCSAAGDVYNAHVLADHGIAHAPNEAMRKHFQNLKASLPPAPPEKEKAEAPKAES